MPEPATSAEGSAGRPGLPFTLMPAPGDSPRWPWTRWTPCTRARTGRTRPRSSEADTLIVELARLTGESKTRVVIVAPGGSLLIDRADEGAAPLRVLLEGETG